MDRAGRRDLLTAGVDVQDDRLAVALWAWGRGETAWCVGWTELLGDPISEAVWRALDELLARRWPHASGATLPIAMTAIDTGGHRTQAVYAYVRAARAHRHGREGREPARTTRHRHAARRWSTSTSTAGRSRTACSCGPSARDTAKAELYARLALAEGPRSVHFAADLPLDFYVQLTAERRVTRYVRGVARQEWTPAERRTQRGARHDRVRLRRRAAPRPGAGRLGPARGGARDPARDDVGAADVDPEPLRARMVTLAVTAEGRGRGRGVVDHPAPARARRRAPPRRWRRCTDATSRPWYVHMRLNVTRLPTGVTVTVAAPDPTREVLARCPACERGVLFGAMVGTVCLSCRHCRIAICVTVAAASKLP